MMFITLIKFRKKASDVVEVGKKIMQKYHKIRNELYQGANLATVKDSVIDEYIVLAKILLAKLYDFRGSKLEWEKMTNDARKSVIKDKMNLKELI